MDKRPDDAASPHMAELSVPADKEAAENKMIGDPNGADNKGSVLVTTSADTTAQAEKIEAEISMATMDTAQPEPSRESILSRSETEQETSRKSVTAQSSKKSKEKSRKSKRKSKSEGQESIPSLRKRSTKLIRSKQLEDLLTTAFQPLDSEGTGSVSQEHFWEVLQSPELGLQLTEEELAAIHQQLVAEPTGLIGYVAWAAQAAAVIASAHQDNSDPNMYWVPLTTSADGSSLVYYNKQTGELTNVEGQAPTGDIFDETAAVVFQQADAGGKGYITRDEFVQILQSDTFASSLTQQDYDELLQYFDSFPDGMASYDYFYPLAKDMILKMYRSMDTSESEWCQIDSPLHGIVMLNKLTGETRKPEEPAPQPPLVQGEGADMLKSLGETFAQVESLTRENSQLKEYNKDILNQLAAANEELEVMAAHLDETGRDLDIANATIKEKEEELSGLHSIVAQKDQDIEELRAMMLGGDSVQSKLDNTTTDLQRAMEMVAERDKTIAEKEKIVSDLRHQTQSITDKLKSARGVIDAHESSISKLQHELQLTKERVQAYERNLPTLEGGARSAEDDLSRTRQALEEKSTALSQARKQLKAVKERNMTLEEEMQKVTQLSDKLHQAESEVATLKSFLTSKTALVEKRKKELKELRIKLSEIEEKDARRAAILADVLEKTAINYQQQLKTPLTSGTLQHGSSLQSDSPRPCSAPEVARSEGALPPLLKEVPATVLQSPTRRQLPVTYEGSRHRRSLTVPKLPPIHHSSKKMDFSYPTTQDIKMLRRHKDNELIDHSHSNPQCACHLCKINTSLVDPSARDRGGQGSTDPKHTAQVQSQVRLGTRVLARLKRSEFDLEPQKLTGVVKYIGKIDSEFVDNQIYVGLKLDEPVGDTDGLLKGKRYFTCPPKHGKLVKINNIVALLPNKSVFYRPVQDGIKRTPYGSHIQKQKPSEIRVS